MSDFKDNFSKQANIYAKYRPHYPPELYSYLSSLTKEHELAWDCGTGNGQAAIGLTEFYKKIIATDPSEQQIQNAVPHSNIKYLVEKAENNSIVSNSVDILTIANALHWFDFDVFYKEANRVLKKNGIIAAWAYGIPFISAEVDKVVAHFHYGILDDYWQPENRLVEKEYTTIPFPFQHIEAPSFFSERTMNLVDFIGYLNTWSATQRFMVQHKFNPTEKLFEELKTMWNEHDRKKITWKIVLKIGTVSKASE